MINPIPAKLRNMISETSIQTFPYAQERSVLNENAGGICITNFNVLSRDVTKLKQKEKKIHTTWKNNRFHSLIGLHSIWVFTEQ